MSRCFFLASYNLVQAVTMATVAGETVKPDGFLVPKICDVPARFSSGKFSSPARTRGFAGKIGVFGIPA
jgi:hypothetical protein